MDSCVEVDVLVEFAIGVVSRVGSGIGVLGGVDVLQAEGTVFGVGKQCRGRLWVDTTDYLKKSGVCISMTRTTGRGKCFLQQFSEFLWSKLVMSLFHRMIGEMDFWYFCV